MARTLDKGNQEIDRMCVDEGQSMLYTEDQTVFSVEKILDIRGTGTGIEYLIKWKGYSAKHNEWVAEKNVTADLKQFFSREKKQREIKRLQAESIARRAKRAQNAFKRSSTTTTPIERENVESFAESTTTTSIERENVESSEEIPNESEVKECETKKVPVLIAPPEEHSVNELNSSMREESATLPEEVIAELMQTTSNLKADYMDHLFLSNSLDSVREQNLEKWLLGFDERLEPVSEYL